MEENVRVEREISIVDLLWFVLKEWRKIIVACILGVIVFGLFFVYKNRNVLLKKDGTQSVENMAVQNEALLDGNIEADNIEENSYQATIDAYNQSIKSSRVNLSKLQEYADNSLLMKFDAYNVPKMVIGYDINLLVENDNNEVPDFIYKAIYQKYVDFFNNEFEWKKLEGLTDIKQKYLREVITMSPKTNYIGFSINIRFMDEDMMLKIKDIIVADMARAINEISNVENIKHTINVTENAIDYIKDDEAYNVQNANANNINSILTRIDSLETRLLKFSKDKKNSAPVQKLSIKKLIKYLIIGILLGGFAIGFIYFCIYIFADKLHLVDELKSMYGLQLFGVVIENKKNNKLFGFVDEWLKKLMKDYYYKENEENAIKRIVTYIENIGDKKIVMTSSVNTDFVKRIIEKIKTVLKNSGKNISSIDSVVGSAEALKNLASFDCVVLVEELEESKMHDVMIECESMKTMDKEVAGYVIVAKG